MNEITCPKCRARVPKQPICTECGFDIKGYYMAKKQNGPQRITCPGCKEKVPKKAICPECGYDIKSYYLSKKHSKASGEASPPPKPGPRPAERGGRKKVIAIAAAIVLLAVAASAAFFLLGGERELTIEEAYAGCFKDQGNPQGLDGRDMSGIMDNSSKMTVQQCVSFCETRGYDYAGLQYSSYCFCDNDYGSYGTADNCDMPCSGDADQICGGSWANSVYEAVALKAIPSTEPEPAGGTERASAKEEKPRGERKVVWEDPKGDVWGYERMNKPFVDIVGASAIGRDGHLILEAVVDKDIGEYFAFEDSDGYRYGFRPISFFIDGDGSPNSGAIPKWVGNDPGELRGYNLHVEARLGFLYKQEGSDYMASGYGDMKFSPEENIVRGAATYGLERAAGGQQWDMMRRDSDDWSANFDDLASVDGNRIILKVPYEFIGAKKGQTIRLCFKEEGHEGQQELEKFSENKYLLLK